MTKEEKIQESWDRLLPFKPKGGYNLVDGYSMNLYHQVQEPIDYNSFDYEKVTVDKGKIRPKSLKGIENNNGWNTIPSIHEKEIEKGQYWVIYPNGFIEVAYYDGTMECYKFWKLNFSHYQPIEKPKPPLF